MSGTTTHREQLKNVAAQGERWRRRQQRRRRWQRQRLRQRPLLLLPRRWGRMREPRGGGQGLYLFIYSFFLAFGWLENLLLLKNLLNYANSPANSEATRMFNENQREYNRRVQEIVKQSWTAGWPVFRGPLPYAIPATSTSLSHTSSSCGVFSVGGETGWLCCMLTLPFSRFLK